jgi:hypothetical protein
MQDSLSLTPSMTEHLGELTPGAELLLTVKVRVTSSGANGAQFSVVEPPVAGSAEPIEEESTEIAGPVKTMMSKGGGMAGSGETMSEGMP